MSLGAVFPLTVLAFPGTAVIVTRRVMVYLRVTIAFCAPIRSGRGPS